MAKDTHPAAKKTSASKKTSSLSPSMDTNPSDPLPRDDTGRYLHLKLKRFRSENDLTMPYAKKTWREFPYDASVGLAPNSRSSCRWCREKIEKGSVRYQLFLQCHKGCKISAYFHADCIWKYPETTKLSSVEEFNGWKEMPTAEKGNIVTIFDNFVKSRTAPISGTKRQPDGNNSTSVSDNSLSGRNNSKSVSGNPLSHRNDSKSVSGNPGRPAKKKQKSDH